MATPALTRHIPFRRWFVLCLVAVCVAGTVSLAVLRMHSPRYGLPYRDSFGGGSMDEWTAYGGTWEIVNGSMRNNSDERGSKLITGSSYWQNYSVEADVQLLRTGGDTGLIARASDEERGVDAYSGYYAGIRTWGSDRLENSLVIGKAKHGWVEYASRRMPAGVHPLEWYHLRLLAYGCTITATATNPQTGDSLSVSLYDRNCFKAGRIGLRSFASGGIWRNVRVLPVTAQVPNAGPVVMAPPPPFALQYAPGAAEGDVDPGDGEIERSNDSKTSATVSLPVIAPTASSLRLLSRTTGTLATVHGVVVLTSPLVYIQDSTGGVAVQIRDSLPLRTGDEVEVTGEAEPGAYSSSLRNASIRVLWEREPVPPVSVTASQAATGTYDATFIELEGFLRDKIPGPNGTWILDLEYGGQSFRAITNSGGKEQLPRLSANSLLRLRGICVVDPQYTKALVPFVLLLPSTNAVETVAGPPWWSARYLTVFGIAVLLLLLTAHLVYMRVRNWRLRAVIEERGRLAHELHDTLAQSFAGIGFQLEAIQNSVPKDAASVHQQLDLALSLVRHSHDEARHSIASLRPETLENFELVQALESRANHMVQGGATKITVSSSGTSSPIPLQIKDTLFRIGQEAIANAIRHAKPTTVHVEVNYEADTIHLTVQDDGVGFCPGARHSGFGLIGMQRRADSISAVLKIDSTLSRGTRVYVTAQLPPRITAWNWPRHLYRRVVEGRHHGAFRGSENPYSCR